LVKSQKILSNVEYFILTSEIIAVCLASFLWHSVADYEVYYSHLIIS